jgi:hypothetical protein
MIWTSAEGAHKGPVKDLRASEPKGLDPSLFYSELFLVIKIGVWSQNISYL